MKKTRIRFVTLLFALLMVLSLVGCESADYQSAKEAFQGRRYREAIELFTSLGDYKDSMQCAKDARWKFIEQFIDENGTYIKELDQKGIIREYPDHLTSEYDIRYAISISYSNGKIIFANISEQTDSSHLKSNRLVTITISPNSSSAEVVYSYDFFYNSVKIKEEGKGTINLSTCTQSTQLEIAEFSQKGYNGSKVTLSKTNPEDSVLVVKSAEKGFPALLRELPGFMNGLGLPVTLSDLGFLSLT